VWVDPVASGDSMPIACRMGLLFAAWGVTLDWASLRIGHLLGLGVTLDWASLWIWHLLGISWLAREQTEAINQHARRPAAEGKGVYEVHVTNPCQRGGHSMYQKAPPAHSHATRFLDTCADSMRTIASEF